jgi:hypothetical protein
MPLARSDLWKASTGPKAHSVLPSASLPYIIIIIIIIIIIKVKGEVPVLK